MAIGDLYQGFSYRSPCEENNNNLDQSEEVCDIQPITMKIDKLRKLHQNNGNQSPNNISYVSTIKKDPGSIFKLKHEFGSQGDKRDLKEFVYLDEQQSVI